MATPIPKNHARFSLGEIASITGGTVIGDPARITVGVSTDSRAVGTEELFVALVGARLDAQGCLVVVAQEARTQAGNLAKAREKLADLVRRALDPPKARHKTRPTKASKRRRLEGKRATSEKKAGRGRVSGD